jgi:hypothetical protein
MVVKGFLIVIVLINFKLASAASARSLQRTPYRFAGNALQCDEKKHELINLNSHYPTPDTNLDQYNAFNIDQTRIL